MKTHYTMFVIGCIIFSMLGIPVVGEESGDKYALYKTVLDRLENLTPGDTIDVRMGTEKETYFVGEPFELRFMVSDACYAVLMDIGASTGDPPAYGPISFFIPSYKALENKLEPGKVYSSVHDFDMTITVGDPSGHETVNLFCSPEPLALFDADFTKERIYTIQPNDTDKLQALLDRLELLEQIEWSGSSISFLIKDEKGTPKALPKKFGMLKPMGGTGTTGKFFPPLEKP